MREQRPLAALLSLLLALPGPAFAGQQVRAQASPRPLAAPAPLLPVELAPTLPVITEGPPALAPLSPALAAAVSVPASESVAELVLPPAAPVAEALPARLGGAQERPGERSVEAQMEAFQAAVDAAKQEGLVPDLGALWDGGGEDDDAGGAVTATGRQASAQDRFYADQQEDEDGGRAVSRWTQEDRSVGEVWRNGFLEYILRAGHESFDVALAALAGQLGAPFTVPVLRALSEAGEETRTDGLEPVRLSARAALFLAREMGFGSETKAFTRVAAFHAGQNPHLREVDVASAHHEPELATPVPIAAEVPLDAAVPSESPFLARLREVNDMLESRGLPRALTLEALADRVSSALGVEVDPWMLAGWRKMPDGLRRSAAEAAADVLLRDAREALGLDPEPAEVGRFLVEAEAFLRVGRLDIEAGQASPWRKSFGGILRALREDRGLTRARLGDLVGRLSPLGRPLVRHSIGDWELDKTVDYEGTLLHGYIKIIADLYGLGQAGRQALIWALQRGRHARLAAGSVAALGPGRPLREYLGALVRAAALPPSAVERQLGLPAGAMEAYLDGGALPSREILDRFRAHFGLSTIEFEFMLSTAAQELAALRARDSKAAALAQVLGAATSETPLREVLSSLFDGPFERAEAQRALIERGLEEKTLRVYLLSERSARRHKASTARAVAEALAPQGSSANRLIDSIARAARPRRAMGAMIEEFVQGGGSSFSAFLRLVLDEYGVSTKGLHKESGVDETALRRWIDEQTKTPEEPALGDFARHFELDDQQTRALWHLARGEKTALPPLLNGVRARLAAEPLRQEFPAPSRELLSALVRRSGLSDKEIAHLAQVTPSMVSAWRHGRMVEIPVEKADRIAWTLLPHEMDGPAAARSLANLLLGMAEELSMDALLERARGGRVDFAGIVLHTRLRYRLSYAGYARFRHGGRGGEEQVAPKTVHAWESGRTTMASWDTARRWAAYVGGARHQDELARLAMGRSLVPRRAGDALAAFLRDGGREFPAFLRLLLQEYDLTPEGFSTQAGLSTRTIPNWLHQTTAAPEEEPLTRFAEHLGIEGRSRRALWHLARGDTSVDLHELRGAALATALIRRSGVSNLEIQRLTGASHSAVSGWRNGKGPRISPEMAYQLAAAVLPHESEGEGAARSLAGRIMDADGTP